MLGLTKTGVNMTQNQVLGLLSDAASRGGVEVSDSSKRGRSLGTGIAVGLALGAGVGTAMRNIALGVAVGISIGVALGMSLERRAVPDEVGTKRWTKMTWGAVVLAGIAVLVAIIIMALE